MVGGSYGGGIQWRYGRHRPPSRRDRAGDLLEHPELALYPNQAFKTAWSTLLLLALVEAGARVNPELYSGILTGVLLGILTPSARALLTRSGPASSCRRHHRADVADPGHRRRVVPAAAIHYQRAAAGRLASRSR